MTLAFKVSIPLTLNIILSYNLIIQVTVLGTPAEELGGGKIDMIEKGAFSEQYDVSMMCHPSRFDTSHVDMLAVSM